MTLAQLQGLEYDGPQEYQDTTTVGSFGYVVSDGAGGVASGSVTLTVLEVNDLPGADSRVVGGAVGLI